MMDDSLDNENENNNQQQHDGKREKKHPINFEYQAHVMMKNSRVGHPYDLVSKEQLENCLETMKKLHKHRYLLKSPELKDLFEAGSALFNPLTEEEKIERRRQRRKQAKEGRKSHDETILNNTEMKKRKINEISIIKEQLEERKALECSNLDQAETSLVKMGIETDEMKKKKRKHMMPDIGLKRIKKQDVLKLSNSVDEDDEDVTIESITDDSNQTASSSSASSSHVDSNSMQDEENKATTVPTILFSQRQCYMCKQMFDKVHFFYHKMCTQCGEFNYEKRNATCDLSGRVALVTGGRVKIGYESSLKLLRNNISMVIVTTRFPKDAAKRYTAEPDFDQWKDKLQIYGLDMKHIPSVYAFCDFLKQKLDRLDIIINNACQTIRRPCAYYRHVCLDEMTVSLEDLSENVKKILPTDFFMKPEMIEHTDSGIKTLISPTSDELIEHASNNPTSNQIVPYSVDSLRALTDSCNVSTSALISQIPILKEDQLYDSNLFPHKVLDVNKSQVDLRQKNSWVQKLDQVPIFEFLEVQTINVTAPFIINSRLKPLMAKMVDQDKFIINVSSMEGQFYRKTKKTTHPHLNMAKSSLNMMTRTSAADYAKSRIYMVSVDTGWNNDENPLNINNVKETYFCPLDEIDGAARIMHPIFTCIKEGKKIFGVFMKNYDSYYW
ncbi:predicted protein [Naegleria gruberi]|uniref:Predicted protein n=1 Tax=Naegleria gruberi TaxID=5762 RepID=D2VNR0_NAEGR|nr:uncharacterized protein NAEGRDRAFT_70587 [Naegleria gruberi]EFC41454.1 predicted protein [Naegleria gruberi]|eukprot:XP_002674198.1 predicted protein [Naegleria gruberi strain NEG-M]